MIVLEDLKPILEPLLEGREDAAEVIEAVNAIDKPVEEPAPVDNSEEIAKLNEEWNNRFKEAFFGPKGDTLESDPPAVPDVSEEPAPAEEEVTGENITVDDLFEEKIIE